MYGEKWCQPVVTMSFIRMKQTSVGSSRLLSSIWTAPAREKNKKINVKFGRLVCVPHQFLLTLSTPKRWNPGKRTRIIQRRITSRLNDLLKKQNNRGSLFRRLYGRMVKKAEEISTADVTRAHTSPSPGDCLLCAGQHNHLLPYRTVQWLLLLPALLYYMAS